jgi:hypothetical protein
MKRGTARLAALLFISSVVLTASPSLAQVYPSCPPGYYFAPAYGLCFPAGYAYDPGYYYDQGYYPYLPGFGYAPFAFFGGRFGGFHHHFGRGFAGHGGFVGHGHGRR